MVAYGYRLHELTAHLGAKQNELDLIDLGEEDSTKKGIDHFHESLKDLKNRLLIGSPKYARTVDDYREDPFEMPQPDLAEKTSRVPYMKVTKVVRSGNRIEAVVQYGKEGDYEYLLSRDGADPTDMKGKATARGFDVVFLFPSKGTKGVMISETKGRTYAGDALLHWIRATAQRKKFHVKDEDIEQGPWVRWAGSPMFDGHRLEGIAAESEDFTITLKRSSISPAGKRRPGGRVRIQERGIPPYLIKDALDVLKDWWLLRQNGTSESRSARAARDIGTLLSIDVDTEDQGFNDGEITFKEAGKVQTLTPNNVDRLFIYPLGERPITVSQISQAARTPLKTIIDDEAIYVDLSELL